MAKIDLKKVLKPLYTAPANAPVIVDVPKMNYLMVDGAGDPNTTPAFQQAFEALFGTAYTIKFTLKHAGGDDFGVMPPEGLWWADDMSAFSEGRKHEWKWTLMILMPNHVTKKMFADAVAALKKRKDPPALPLLRFEALNEGKSAQIMHVGPYEKVVPTIEKLINFIEEKGFVHHGKHHEIYLNDPRRCVPEKLKTIIRQPVAKP